MRPSGKDLGDYRKRGWWILTPWLWQSLSPHSVCNKSPNLLTALLPLPDLSLKQCWRWVWPCVGKGGFPGAIRPKKECIKSCESCFANNLSLNDKGSSIKWVCFPKFYGPLAIWPQLRINPHSSLNVIYYLIIAAWQWLMNFTCIPVQIELNKSPLRNRFKAFSCERLATFPPQADHVLVDLFSSAMARGLCWTKLPHRVPKSNRMRLWPGKYFLSYKILIFFVYWFHYFLNRWVEEL